MEMEEDGLVTRTEYVEVPIRIEYTISEKAKALGPILMQMVQWALNTEARGKACNISNE